MSHKYVVLYNTVGGAIFVVGGNPPPDTVLASGSGTVSGENMTGIDLDGNAQEDVEWVRLDGYKKMIIEEWVSDTEILFQNNARLFQGTRDYELIKEGAVVQFTAQQKATMIADMKIEVGHDNVGALLISANFHIDSSWKVNTSTNQLEKKTADITYD